MQIRHTLELFYTAHVLTKNNLSALMIEIEPNLLKGKKRTMTMPKDVKNTSRKNDDRIVNG